MFYLSIDCEFSAKITENESKKSIKTFATLLENYSLQGEFFVSPQLLPSHNEIFQELAKKHLISLHLHPNKFCPEYFGQKIELGNLSAEKQQKILKNALEKFRQNLQFHPHGFRPGMASANLQTVEILTKLGIKNGSISIPNYVNSKYKINWQNFSKTPHFIQTASGDFYNLPLTNNYCISGKSNFDPQFFENYLAIYTHNFFDFAAENAISQKIKSIIDFADLSKNVFLPNG